jgi:hypothetical protein
MSIKRHEVLLDVGGAATGAWFRLDSRYADGDTRAIQGSIAAGSVDLEGTTVDIKGTISFGQDVLGNGQFNTEANWILGDGWSIDLQANLASCDGTQTAASNLKQRNSNLQEGDTYEVTFTISGYAAGTVTPIVNGTVGTARSADGTFTELIVAGSGNPEILLQADSLFVGEISDVQAILDVPAADVEILQSYVGDFSDVINSSWTYVRAVKIGAGAAKVQGNI